MSAEQKAIRFIPLSLGLDAYLITAWCSYQAFKVRKFDYAPTPTQLLTYKEKPEWRTRAKVVTTMENAHETSAKVIGDKALWLRMSTVALVVQVGVLVVALVAEVLLI
jgi:hypothetical protein